MTTIIYTLTDSNAHSVTCSFTVTVESKPAISCPADITGNTDSGICSASLDPGLPTKISGSEPIIYTWKMDGATSTAVFAPGPIGIYTFNKGITTITWHAQNISGFDECTQLITIEDHQSPTFILPPSCHLVC